MGEPRRTRGFWTAAGADFAGSARGRVGRLLLSAASASLLVVSAVGCGASSSARPVAPKPSGPAGVRSTGLVVHRPRLGLAWRPEATVGGRVAMWMARRAGVTLMRFDQRLVRLALHAGRLNPGGRGWTYGDHVGPPERRRLVAAFNGGFRLDYGSVGFLADGRAPVPLESGLASIVTYRNGMTQIGAWKAGVPARGVPIASVRQNLKLLVDHGIAAPTVAGCIQVCWGGTVGRLASVARSALAIDAAGRLVWAAAEHVTPAALARALVRAGAQRALELDINPKWVAGYVYLHQAAQLTAAPVLPGQKGIYGHFFKSYSRDFFTVLVNGR